MITNIIDQVALPVTANDNWAVPTPIPVRLTTVSPFDPEMLPEPLRTWAVDLSQRMNVPLDFIGVPTIIAASAVLGNRLKIRPQRYSDWTEAANLWGVLIADAGMTKSPAVAQATFAVTKFEEDAREENRRREKAFKTTMAAYDMRKRHAEKDAQAILIDPNCDEQQTQALMEQVLSRVVEPQKPPLERHIVNDATYEKLGEICADNPNGFLVFRDELLGLLRDLSSREKSTDRGFYLAAWSGLSGYTFDRIGRGTIPISSVNFALLGTTQPEVFIPFVRESLASQADGFTQRFQLAIYPDLPKTYVPVDRPEEPELKRAVLHCFQRLRLLKSGDLADFGDDPDVDFLRFDDLAQREFDAWHLGLEQQKWSGDLAPALRSHFSKYKGLAARLALIFHAISGSYGAVGLQSWRLAEKWVAYLEAHARRIYHAALHNHSDTAQLILDHLLTGKLPSVFSSRDLKRKKWSGLTDEDEVEKGLKTLAEFDWIAPMAPGPIGRPAKAWQLNPRAIHAIDEAA